MFFRPDLTLSPGRGMQQLGYHCGLRVSGNSLIQ